MGVEVKIGLVARPERVLLLGVGLILGGSDWLLWIIAVLAASTTFTAVQRIAHVWGQLRRASKAVAGADVSADGHSGLHLAIQSRRAWFAPRVRGASTLDAVEESPPNA
jgi:CDP-diacylglycerol--glycerol-3-phosphate 3-phosphatidyltransferase